MGGEYNILVVESDDKSFRELEGFFKKSNYKLWRATTGKDALKLIKQVYFIAIISELYVPDMNGVELVRKLKKVSGKINISVLTVYSFIDTAIKALNAGAYTYLLKPLNEEEVKLILVRMIENTCLAIQAKRGKYYQDISSMDGLTGVYNHRHFHEIITQQVDHMKRFPQSLSLFMIDIDYFKKYNDTHGHPKGDEILRSTAQVFVNTIREEDIVFRYGGEEFTIIMPRTIQQDAQGVGARLLEIVKAQTPITISIGLATIPDDAQEKSGLIAKADKALYRAKALGRDRICAYDSKMDK